MKHLITASRISELLALKRDEKPPENFFGDFIVEFHKRLEFPGAKPRRNRTRRPTSDAQLKGAEAAQEPIF
jgi:hypothetical protein